MGYLFSKLQICWQQRKNHRCVDRCNTRQAVWFGCKNSKLANPIWLRAVMMAQITFFEAPHSMFSLFATSFRTVLAWQVLKLYPLAQKLRETDFGLTGLSKLGCTLRVESAYLELFCGFWVHEDDAEMHWQQECVQVSCQLNEFIFAG